MNAMTIIEDQTYHVEGVRKFHAEVRTYEASAAVSAWHAGWHIQKLMDEFKLSMRRVSEQTGIPLTTVHRYVAVFRARNSPSGIRQGDSITEIVGETDKATRQREQRKATFGQAEAEYAVKLYRMTESPNENEASVAARKLDQFASDHGMTGEEVIEKSRKTLGLTEEMVRDPMDDAIDKFMTPFKKKSKDDLLALLIYCMTEHPDLIKKLKERINA
jgi:hypothetical protein